LRLKLETEVRRANVRFYGVWLHAPLPVLEARITTRRANASDATVALLRRAAARDPGVVDWLPVDASDCDAALASIQRAIPPQ
jgi:predicted kinase